MTIDDKLLREAVKLQRQAEKEPWMEDISTIKAMRARKVEWKIIHMLIAQKYNLSIGLEVFERQANGLLRSLAFHAAKVKKLRQLNEAKKHQAHHEGGGLKVLTESLTESLPKVRPESLTESLPKVQNEAGFDQLNEQNPIA